mgnify:CR=1 FL=1
MVKTANFLPLLVYGANACILDNKTKICHTKFEPSFCNQGGYNIADRCKNENRTDIGYSCLLDDDEKLLVKIQNTTKAFLFASGDVDFTPNSVS